MPYPFSVSGNEHESDIHNISPGRTGHYQISKRFEKRVGIVIIQMLEGGHSGLNGPRAGGPVYHGPGGVRGAVCSIRAGRKNKHIFDTVFNRLVQFSVHVYDQVDTIDKSSESGRLYLRFLPREQMLVKQ